MQNSSISYQLLQPIKPKDVLQWHRDVVKVMGYSLPTIYRGVEALDQMVRLINIHVRVVEILLWHPSS